MGIISWIVFGLLAGILAKFVMPGDDGGGFVKTTVLRDGVQCPELCHRDCRLGGTLVDLPTSQERLGAFQALYRHQPLDDHPQKQHEQK